MKLTEPNLQAINDVACKIAETVESEYVFAYTNRPDREEEIRGLLEEMRSNLYDFAENVLCDNDELTKLAPYFSRRYPSFLKGTEFAVIFIDRISAMQKLKEEFAISDKGWSQNDYRGTCSNPANMIDYKLFDEYKKRGKEFNSPVSIREGSKLSEPCDLLGFYTTLYGSYLSLYLGDKVENPDAEYPTIFLCVESLNNLAASFREHDDGADYKRIIGERFGIGVSDSYFTENALRLTFAHEFAHMLFAHDNENVKNKMNRESQANFLASILLNDPITSIYMQYKTYFQPVEYQRTLLLYNDFNVVEIGDMLVEALILK